MAKSRVPNSGDETVTFRKSDAQRIANTVHAYESARRPRNSSVLPRAPGGGGGVVTARFTGAWSKDTMKTVTFLVNTTETVSVTNIFSNIAPPLGGYRRCAIAKEGTTWILIAAECQ